MTVPLLVYWLLPPDLKETPEAPQQAREQLRKMGPPSRNEKITLAVLLLAVSM